MIHVYFYFIAFSSIVVVLQIRQVKGKIIRSALKIYGKEKKFLLPHEARHTNVYNINVARHICTGILVYVV